MKVRLLKPHSVNGRDFAPGTVLELRESSVRNLIEWGVGEPFEEPVVPRRFTTSAVPVQVPHTKSPETPTE